MRTHASQLKLEHEMFVVFALTLLRSNVNAWYNYFMGSTDARILQEDDCSKFDLNLLMTT